MKTKEEIMEGRSGDPITLEEAEIVMPGLISSNKENFNLPFEECTFYVPAEGIILVVSEVVREEKVDIFVWDGVSWWEE